jgi:hypothetical protein
LTAVKLPDTIDGVPNVSRAEEVVAQALPGSEWPPLPGTRESGDPFAGIRSACAIALHTHQPLIPAGGEQLRTAEAYRQPAIHFGVRAGATVAWCAVSLT